MRDEFEHIIDQFRQRDNLAIAQLRKLPSGSHIGLPRQSGGDDPIRTDGAFHRHSALAVRCLRPLGHVSMNLLVGMERFELSRAKALVSKTSVSPISTTSPQLTNPVLASREEAAQLLSISQRALDYLIATRRLPTRRIGGRVLIPVSELRKYARTDHPERIVA
jgi:excisionase family DNA binding protein